MLEKAIELVYKDETLIHKVEEGSRLPLRVSVPIKRTPENGAGAVILAGGKFICYVMESAYGLKDYPFKETKLCFEINESGDVCLDTIRFQIEESMILPTISTNPGTFPPAAREYYEQERQRDYMEIKRQINAIEQKVDSLSEKLHLYGILFSDTKIAIAAGGFHTWDVLSKPMDGKAYLVGEDFGCLTIENRKRLIMDSKCADEVIIFEEGKVIYDKESTCYLIIRMIQSLFCNKIDFSVLQEVTGRIFELYDYSDDSQMEKALLDTMDVCEKYKKIDNMSDQAKDVEYDIIHAFQPIYRYFNRYADYFREDPIEQTERFKKAQPVVENVTKILLCFRKRKRGFCHTVWSTQKQLYANLFGIDWLTPAEIGRVIYD